VAYCPIILPPSRTRAGHRLWYDFKQGIQSPMMELEGIAPVTIVHDYKRHGFLFQAAWSPTLIPSTSDGNRASTNQAEAYYSSLIGPQEINFGDIAVAARKHRLLIACSGYHDNALQQASGPTTFH
jgi:hypothetical protein